MDIFNELFGTRLGDNIIFTPQKIALEMIDALPAEIWNKDTKFLDPCCKSGIYLQEIRSKLMNCEDLIQSYPDEQDRLKHIDNEQLYGFSINEACRLLSTRNVYGRLTTDNNIRYIENYISKVKDKNTDYRKIVKEAFGEVKFDVVIGNPPYQESTGSGKNDSGAKPMFGPFILSGLEVSSKIVSMIVPTKWISATQGELIHLREKILEGNHLQVMVDFMNSKECFEDVSIAGGVCYFIHNKEYIGGTNYTTMLVNRWKSVRNLAKAIDNVTGILPRHSVADSVIIKVKQFKEMGLNNYIHKNLWGIATNYDGNNVQLKADDVELITPRGRSYMPKVEVGKTGGFKVKFTRAVTEHGLEPSKDNTYSLLSSLEILKPNEIVNASYMILLSFKKEEYANNGMKYLKTKLARFLLLQTLFGIGLTSERFRYIPFQDFTEKSSIDWSQSIANIDQQLYKKYSLTQE